MSSIELAISDDGIGLSAGHRSGGLGLDSLALRATALEGRLEVLRRQPAGTIIRCTCPQPSSASHALA